MPTTDDAIVIGSGPNGLVAAATLARAGWRVRVLEAQPRPGGACWSVESTLPGFVHDVGAAFFPFAHYSQAILSQKLDEVGLQWRSARYESAHPAADGTCPTLSRDPDLGAATFGADADAYRWLSNWAQSMGPRLADALLAPLPDITPALRLGVGNLFRLAVAGVSSTAGYSRRLFRTEAARRVIPSLALHVDLGPDDFGGAALGAVLGLLALASGFQVPVGGAKSISLALIRRIEEAGGAIQLNTRVKSIEVRQGRAVAVRTEAGDEIPFRKAVLADVGAPALFLRMLPEDSVSGYVRQAMTRYRYGWGTFKLDWALSAPLPWRCEPARHAAVAHTGDSIDDLVRFTAEVRDGQLPTNPYLVIGQQSLLDPTRAPAGRHTLWAYSRVPSTLHGGWAAAKEAFADRIERRIEALAPGFRSTILARAVYAPNDLEAMNENLVGGDLGGGTAQFSNLLFWRPAFPHFRHRTPVAGAYLCSASTHPGAGVHGACGYNAAQAALGEG